MSHAELPHDEQVSDSTRRAIDALQVLLTRSRTSKSLERDRETTSILKDESSPELLDYVNVVSLFENIGDFELISDEDSDDESADAQTLPTNKELLKRFRVLELLGRGGMGEVYKACDRSLDRTVAVKIINPLFDSGGPETRQFQLEAQISANLRHPNIVPVHYLESVGESQYFSMDFVPGCNLQEVISYAESEPNRPFDFLGDLSWSQGLQFKSKSFVQFAASVFEQVARAIEYAHGQGVIHCDIKPSNIMLDDSGKPWVMDFGVAGRAHTGDAMEKHLNGGTRRYMSPELENNGGEADERSDVYALGVTLYEFLTGQRFTRENGSSEEGASALSIRKHQPAISRSLERVVLRALASDVDQRYASARELAVDLGRARQGLAPLRESNPVFDALSQIRNHPVWAVLAVTVLGLLGSAVYFQRTAPANDSQRVAVGGNGVSHDARGQDSSDHLLKSTVLQTQYTLTQLAKRPGHQEEAWETIGSLAPSLVESDLMGWRNVALGFLGDPGALSPRVFSIPKGEISKVALSGDDPLMAISTDQGDLAMFDLTSGDMLTIAQNIQPIYLQFLKKDQLLVADRSGKLGVWICQNGIWNEDRYRQVDGLRELLLPVVADVQGSTLVGLSRDQSSVISIDVDTDAPYRRLTTGHPNLKLTDVKYIAESQTTVASCAENDQRIGLLRWQSGNELPDRPITGDSVRNMSKVSAKTLFACTSKKRMMVVDLAEWKHLTSVTSNSYRTLTRSANGTTVAALEQGRIRLLDTTNQPNGTPAVRGVTDLEIPFRSFDAVGSVNTFLSGCGRRLVAIDCGEISYWDLNRSEEVVEWRGNSAEIISMRLSPDGGKLAMIGGGVGTRSVRFWNTSKSTLIKEIEFEENLKSLDYSPCGRYLAVVDERNRVFMIEEDSETPSLIVESEKKVLGIQFDADGSRLLAFGTNQILELDLPGTPSLKKQWVPVAEGLEIATALYTNHREFPIAVLAKDSTVWLMSDSHQWSKTQWKDVDHMFVVGDLGLGLTQPSGQLLSELERHLVSVSDGNLTPITDDEFRHASFDKFLMPGSKSSYWMANANSSGQILFRVPGTGNYETIDCHLSTDENHLAVASKVGKVVVWDLRKLRNKLAEIDLGW